MPVAPGEVVVPGGGAGPVPVGAVPVGAAVGMDPPAPVDVGIVTVAAGGALPGPCLGVELLNLCLFRLGRFALCTVGVERPITATRSPLSTDDDRGGEEAVWTSETARDDP